MKPKTSFKLPPELFTAMQYIHDNFSDISIPLKNKLNFLATNLLNHYATENENLAYSFLIIPSGKELKHEEELIQYAQILNLSPEISSKIYVDTVSILFPSSQLILSSVIKKSKLFVQSQTLKLWGERIIELNYGRKTFIIHKSSPKKPDKILDLMTYELKWLGEIKSRFCFGLDSKTSKNHYKSFCIGSENMEVSRDWYESIRLTVVGCYVSTFIEHRNKRDKMFKKSRKTQDDINVVSNQEDPNKPVKTFKEIKEEHEKKKEMRGFLIKNKKNFQSFNETSVSALTGFDNDDILESKHQKKNNNDKTETPKKIQSLCLEENIVLLDENQDSEKKGNNSPNFKMLETEFKKSNLENESLFFSFVNQNQSEILDKKDISKNEMNHKEMIKVLNKEKKIRRKKISPKKTRKIQLKKSKLIKKIKISNFFLMKFSQTKNKNRKAFYYFMKSQHILRDENEFLYRDNIKDIKNNSNIEFFEIRSSLKVNISTLFQPSNYKSIKSEENLLMLQHKCKKTKFKLFFFLPFNFRLILHYLIERKHVLEYNKYVSVFRFLTNFDNSGKSGVLSLLKLKTEIDNKELELYFQRHFFENDDYFIIHDKAVNFSVSENDSFSKDYVNYSIIIRKKQDLLENNVVLEIQFKDKAILAKNEIFDPILNYFKSFSNMRHFFTEKICPLMRNYKSNKNLVKNQIFDQIEIKNFLKEKFLIANMSQCLDSPNFMKLQKSLIISELQIIGSSKELNFKSKSINRRKRSESFFKVFLKSCNDDCQNKPPQGKEITFLLDYIKNKCHEKIHFSLNNDPSFISAVNYFIRISKNFMNSSNWKKALLKNHFLLDQRKFLLKFKAENFEKLKNGINLFEIPYPIHFFSYETCLERLGKAFRFAPFFLDPLIDSSPIEKMKGITSFVIVFLNELIDPLLPFPNLNGGTLTLKINYENFIYFEVIGEKIAMLFIGKKIKIFGQISPNFKIFQNEFVLGFELQLNFVFPQQHIIKIIEAPLLKSYDDSLGNRVFAYEGKSLIYDETNEILSEIYFNCKDLDKLAFSFSGKPLINLEEFNGWIKYVPKTKLMDSIQKGVSHKKFKINKEIKKLCKIDGDILNSFSFDKNIVWEFDNNKNKIYIDVTIGENNLPSCCIFREDLLCFRAGKLEKADFLKAKLDCFFFKKNKF